MTMVPAGKTQEGPVPTELLPSQTNQERRREETNQKPSGIISGEWVKQLDGEVGPGRDSKYYKFYVNKEGSVYNGRSRNIVSPEEMRAWMRYGRGKIVELAEGIRGGKIRISPYWLGEKETACHFCEYRVLCRVEPSYNKYRYLAKYTKNEVLEKIIKAGK